MKENKYRVSINIHCIHIKIIYFFSLAARIVVAAQPQSVEIKVKQSCDRILPSMAACALLSENHGAQQCFAAEPGNMLCRIGCQHDGITVIQHERVQHDGITVIQRDEGVQHDSISVIQHEGVQHGSEYDRFRGSL